MEIRRGGVETGLDGKGLAPFQFFAQFAFINQIGDAAFDQLHLFIDRNHQNLLSLPVREDSPAGGGNAWSGWGRVQTCLVSCCRQTGDCQ